ncbi:hypothetical protein ACFX1Z_024200 [Malus domestica]
MTSYGHGPGYSTRPAYSTGPSHSTGPAYSTGLAYSTGSNKVRPYTNEWGQTRHGSPLGGNYGYAAIGDNWSIRLSSPPRQTFLPARTYGSYPNQSGYNRPPGYGDYNDQYSTNKPYKHSWVMAPGDAACDDYAVANQRDNRVDEPDERGVHVVPRVMEGIGCTTNSEALQ